MCCVYLCIITVSQWGIKVCVCSIQCVDRAVVEAVPEPASFFFSSWSHHLSWGKLAGSAPHQLGLEWWPRGRWGWFVEEQILTSLRPDTVVFFYMERRYSGSQPGIKIGSPKNKNKNKTPQPYHMTCSSGLPSPNGWLQFPLEILTLQFEKDYFFWAMASLPSLTLTFMLELVESYFGPWGRAQW